VISEQHEQAEFRTKRAEEAEQRARVAAREPWRQRAEAELRQHRASLHEREMADHELVEDHERERFTGTSTAADEVAEGSKRRR
jgi:hypothetical protein